MQAKALSEIEQAVQDYVTQECGTAYTVTYTGEQTRDNDWKCDGWRFAIKGQYFNYFTGLGHRVDSKASKQARIALKNVNHKSIAWVNGVEKQMIPAVPPLAGLLYSLLLDGSACEQSFEQWCMEYNYDRDSRKALGTYEACQQNYDKLRKIFTGAQIASIRELLQDY